MNINGKSLCFSCFYFDALNYICGINTNYPYLDIEKVYDCSDYKKE